MLLVFLINTETGQIALLDLVLGLAQLTLCAG
jgi:hypothetical protein